MDIFLQKKLLVRIVVVLATLNLGCMGVFVWKVLVPPQRQSGPDRMPSGGRDFTEILRKELNLAPEQVESIRKLRADYADQEKKLVEAIRMERDSMNAEMFRESTSEARVRDFAARIAQGEMQMEMLRYRQSVDLKSVCTPEQVKRFEALVREMRDFFRPDNQPAANRRQEPPGPRGPGNQPPRNDERNRPADRR